MTRSAKRVSYRRFAIVMSIAWACGSREGVLGDPSGAGSASTEASGVEVPPPADDVSSQGVQNPVPPTATSSSVHWPPGGKKCRLVHCSNRVFFVGDAPGGWKGALNVEACVEGQCESMVVDLARAKKEGSIRGRELIAEVISASLYCPPSLERVCASTGLGRRLAQQREGQSLFVLAVDTQSTGKQPVEVELTLAKSGRADVVLSETVAFDDGTLCHRPNGSGCEPECCESLRDF